MACPEPPPLADAAARRQALDPETSCIVQAPAGSGKTTLLVNRFAALLARVERPEQILAITFTRKATAEMRGRVLGLLRADNLLKLRAEDRDLARAIRKRDAQKGWNLATNPTRLKIQTIDSFAASLTGAMPLGAEVNLRAQPTELAEPLYNQAVDKLCKRLRADPLAADVGRLLMLLDNNADRTRRLVTDMLQRRDQWLGPVRELFTLHTEQPQALGPFLNEARADLAASTCQEMERILGPKLLEELRCLVAFAAEHNGAQGPFWPAAKALCMTEKNELRKVLNKKNGFPAGCRDEKKRVLALIAALRSLGLERRFAALTNLPEKPLTDDQIQELASVCVALALAVLDLNAVMGEQHAIDFPQLNIAARQALAEPNGPTDLALAMDYRIRHILVDEFQDTSNAQFELFSLLLEGWDPNGGESFFAVGDPMQSIYRFRDADVGLFQRACRKGINQVPLQPLRLTANFRSAPGLVDWLNSVFPGIMGETGDALTGQVGYSPATAQQQGEGGADWRLFDDPRSEVDALLQHIRALSQADPHSSIAILVRGRTHLPPILAALRRKNIPWQATDIDPLAETPIVLDLLSLAAALTDPWNRLAWLSVLRTPWVGLDLPDLECAARLPEFSLPTLRALPDQLSKVGKGRLNRLLQALGRWLPELYEGAPRTPLEAIWLECGGPAAYADRAVLDHAQRFLDLVDQLGADGLHVNLLRQRAEALYAADSAEAQLQILTIHKAKGLEFDHVLLPCLNKGVGRDRAPVLRWRRHGRQLLMATKGSGALYHWLADEEKARERHELQRLLYVACTRARRSLLLTGCVARKDSQPPEATAPLAVKPPRKDSMLALLWPGLQDNRPKIESSTRAAEEHPARSLTLHQLRDGFVWRPPAPAPLTLSDSVEFRQGAGEDLAANKLEVVLGDLIHQCLCAWGRNGPPADGQAWFAVRRRQWRSRLLAAGLGKGERLYCLAEAERQLTNVLLDPQGRWLLGPRNQAASEFAVTGVLDDALVSAYFDRIFLHEGVRWIIDFKTGRGAPGEASIQEQAARHRPQLARYRALAEALYDEPIKTAVYLTAIPKLIEVHTEPAAR